MNIYKIDLNKTSHEFEKEQLIVKSDSSGTYVVYKCKRCGLGARKYKDSDLLIVRSRKKLTDEQLLRCSKEIISIPAKRIRVLHKPNIANPAFDNLIVGSEHECIPPPPGQPNRLPGVWVNGIGEPVKLLNGEFEWID